MTEYKFEMDLDRQAIEQYCGSYFLKERDLYRSIRHLLKSFQPEDLTRRIFKYNRQDRDLICNPYHVLEIIEKAIEAGED